ncbi:MAG: aminotransferase class V-fold PLP-dependent enzyme [bacterium]|nr:aminotransferase class V-fold PLP-dependent enzyme [bacterium]
MVKKKLIYLDNAATSFPKPEQVYQKMDHCMRNIGANPGRSGHRMAIKADEMVYNTRETIKKLFNISNSENIIFTSNATIALNLGIKGVLQKGDEVISSSIEHNSVFRPLMQLIKKGVRVKFIPCSEDGFLDPDDVEKAVTDKTKLIIVNHASNVTGNITPIKEIGKIAKRSGAIFFIDAAQTAGNISIDVKRDYIDMLACSGHKSLLGPQGTGILYVRPGIELNTIIEGGTGSSSESENQPELLPDKLESGTLNTVGIVGLGAGVDFILKTGLDKIRNRKVFLTIKLLKGLENLNGIKIYGPGDAGKIVPIVSFNINSIDPSEVGYLLDERFGIMTRVGLHCSPLAHKTIGSFPKGTVRVSLGYFNTEGDIDYLINSLKNILKTKA